MEFLTLYCEPIKLEEGDLYALGERNTLHIFPKNSSMIYIASKFDLDNLDKEIIVNTIGDILKYQRLYPIPKWKGYIPKKDKD